MAPNVTSGATTTVGGRPRTGTATLPNMTELSLTRYVLLSLIGRTIDCPSTTAAKLKSLVHSIQNENDDFFSGVCQQLQLTSNSAQLTFNMLADELFQDSVNWGRIVSFFAFAVKVAEHFERQGNTQMVENVVAWTADYMRQLRVWIEQEGGGWDDFYHNFNPQCTGTRKLLWKGFLVTATTLGLGAFVAIACRS